MEEQNKVDTQDSKTKKLTVAKPKSKGVTVKVVKHPSATVPTYKTPGSSGMDLHANITYPKWLAPGAVEVIPTGITIADIPEGYEIQIRSRSGLAGTYHIFVLNSPGTGDSDFRGELGVILANFGKDRFEIKPQMRIAQAILARVEKAEIQVVTKEEIAQTERGAGGFGSTGV